MYEDAISKLQELSETMERKASEALNKTASANDYTEADMAKARWEGILEAIEFLKDPQRKTGKTPWIYETGQFESDILGSGGDYNWIYRTRNEKDAIFESRRNGRNYLRRFYYDEKQRRIEETYDYRTGKWF